MDARFCPWCGLALRGTTLRFEAVPGPAGHGVAPAKVLLAVWAVVIGLVAIFLFGVFGIWWAEAVLVPATFLVAYAWWDPVIERAGSRVSRLARRGASSAWSQVRVARAALAGWVGRCWAHVVVRARQFQVHRRHDRAIRLLGQAVYTGDAERISRAKAEAVETGDQIERFEQELASARAKAARRLEQERAASDATARFDADRLVSAGRRSAGRDLS